MIIEQQPTYYPFAKAHKAASYIQQLLAPHCMPGRCLIAGSIRRMQPHVKDIEIVCEPIKEFKQTGLYPEVGEYFITEKFSEALNTIIDRVEKGSVVGRYIQIITNSKLCPGIKLDLFLPQPEDYFRQYAIRTGDKDYAHHVIAAAWSRHGWVGLKDIGLRKRSDCDCKEVSGKKVYTLKPQTSNSKPQTPPAWQSEAEFFTWLGLPYIDPEHRIVSISNEAL